MSRYVDADALMNQWCDEMCKPKPSCEEDCAIYDYVRLAPSIDIVRCQDCRYRYMDADLQVWTCTYGLMIKPDGFCNYGERTEKERASDGHSKNGT